MTDIQALQAAVRELRHDVDWLKAQRAEDEREVEEAAAKFRAVAQPAGGARSIGAG